MKWIHWLSQVEFWYNTCMHSTIGVFPFETLYGHPPRVFGILAATSSVEALDGWLQERKVMTDLIQQHLHRAASRLKL
jgi:hypothetical protein